MPWRIYVMDQINKLTFNFGPEQLIAQDNAEAARKLAADRDWPCLARPMGLV
jgi:hypothetical protein